ncbi:MAG: CoA ester lyase, partial [Actinobacteria bacterium]|nr:CoA ester lyase [Actinomycetota bacterium]NIS28968.1 CoA ester lyase [Actinomycetota bacterium]NIT94268.1 CoA ester lyase [Actinomycetota bacterium]NIU17873.1 CoA ester lyase [Actinomycetota bacterium]NIU64393.1 CoA ester lyase [Actinomycetota bacterium]
LFAPAVRPDLVAKMPGTGADLVVIDLEDATPVGAKEEARSTLADLVGS